MRLRFDEVRGVLKLTCPPRTSRARAEAWVAEQKGWIERQIASAGSPEPFAPGSRIPVAGEALLLVSDAKAPRSGRRVDDRLEFGGPLQSFARRVEIWLRREALAVMTAEVAEFAAIIGVNADAVSVGDAASRWGSCSSAGRIRLSWRLIMASPEARRFVVAHEVAHLRHLDHSPAFRALEAALVGSGLSRARAALRAEGPRLRRLGRGR